MKRNDLRRELWNFLYSQGFPSIINDETLMLATRKANYEAMRGKHLRLKHWIFISGGEHDEDVALTMLLARALGLKEGVDWDWGLELDGYHFDIAFSHGDKVEELLRFLELYNEAFLVLLNVSMKLESADSLKDHELQQMFAKEWKRIREEKQRLELEVIQKLKEILCER